MNDERKYSCLKLETPNDVQAIISEVLEEIRSEGKAVEMSGRVCNLLQVWLRAFEITKVSELEKRILLLEERR